MEVSATAAIYGVEPTSIDVSIRGKWVHVPALKLDKHVITVRGSRIRIAAVHDEEWMESEIGDPSRYLGALKQKRAPRADIFTFTQQPPDTGIRYSYRVEPVSIAVADVSNFQQWWQALPQETRKNVRRAEKRGVVVRSESFSDDLIRGIAEVQNETPLRQGRRYTHYGKTFEQVKRDHSGLLDQSEFICAYSGEELIGFLKVIYRGRIASVLQLNAKIAHYDKRPTNALLAKAVELCAAKGIAYLTYGRFNYGNKDDSSIRDFKIRNGFAEVLVPRYYVPLTLWGRFCVRARLYRGLMDVLPRSVIGAFLSLRTRLYSVTLFSRRCSSMPERPNCNRQMGCSNPPAGSNP